MRKVLMVWIVVGCSALACLPVGEVYPTLSPETPRPLSVPRRLDDRTEAYLTTLQGSDTGALLADLLRRRAIMVEWKLQDQIGDAGVSRRNELLLASDILPDPTAGDVEARWMIYGAIILAHEVTHHLMGDTWVVAEKGSEYARRAETRARIVEARVFCELLAVREGTTVNYHREDVVDDPRYAEALSEVDVDHLLEGISPLDEDLARRVLEFPQVGP